MKKKDLKVLNFPKNQEKLEKQIEAILFAAEEPLDEQSIQEKLNTKKKHKSFFRISAKSIFKSWN